MVNGISEKGLSVNHEVKIVNFACGTSEKTLVKLDDIIKKQPVNLVFHVRTNDLTNNVNLLTNVRKIFNKVSKISPSTSILQSPIVFDIHFYSRQDEHVENLNRYQCLFEKYLHGKRNSFY